MDMVENFYTNPMKNVDSIPSQSDDRSQSSGTRVKEKSFGIGNKQKPISHKTDDSSRRPTLRRSLSQNDFKCHDGYSVSSSSF